MAKDPAFLFYFQDFLVGTSFMTLEEIGAYIKLLCFQAAKGPLSEVDILKKIPTPIWQAICCKFVCKDGMYVNERLFKEIEKRQLYCENRRNNLHMGKHMKKHMKGAMTAHMEDEDVNEDENVIKDEDYPYLKNKDFKLTFNSYLKTRKKKATDHAKELILKDLHKISQAEAIAMLEQSIKQGWIGIFPIKKENDNGKNKHNIGQDSKQ